MQVKASAKFIRISPRKARIVIDVVRGMDVTNALQQLHVNPKKSTKPVVKLINSAIANAEHNFELKKSNLYIKHITVNDGPTLTRWMPRAFGRATPLRKRTSHIDVILDEKVPTEKAHKPRAAKKTAAEQTVKMTTTKEAQEAEDAPSTEENVTADQVAGHATEPVDPRSQGKHRHSQHSDGKTKSDKGFLKKVFRRKSGE